MASGSSSRVSPSRAAIRLTCVSTTTPSAMPKPTPSTTLAVLRPTPGSAVSASRSAGTSPPCRSSSARARPISAFDLLRKKLSVFRCSSISSCDASAIVRRGGKRAKSAASRG
jgi:hypothetical protein